MPSTILGGSQGLFGTLRESVPQLAGVETNKWMTSQFTESLRPPDIIQNYLLPGVSPQAAVVKKTRSGPAGQINLTELTRWYHSKNLEGKKHTPDEWKSAMEFVKQRAVSRRGESTTGRTSSSGNREGVTLHLAQKKQDVKDSFAKHLNEVGTYVRRLLELLKSMEREISTMKGAIKQLEGWIAARTQWPIKVNEKCQFYRDQRIGIDLVSDEFEIELGKELQMLTTVIENNSSEVLDNAYATLADMQDIRLALMADIKRKRSAQALDTRMDKLKASITLEPEIDTIELRPPTSIDVDQWRELTDALIKRCEDSMTNCDTLRDTMLSVPADCDGTVRTFGDHCAKALSDKLKLSTEARDEVRMLLEQTKEEIADSIKEIETLEQTIDAQQIPLSYATTRLEKRRARPEEERTIDQVHNSLIEEVAEMDAAVSALQSELNINMANLEDLKKMEAMLEEDFGIKKVTVAIETRCTKIRSYLSPDADNYVVVRMLEDDEFFDLMTR